LRRRWSMPLLPRIETESCDQAKKGHRTFRFSLLTAYVLYCTSPVTRVGAAQWVEPARALGGSGGAGRSGNALALVGVGLPPATVGSRAGGLDRHRTELRTVLFFRSRPLGPMLTRQQKTAIVCSKFGARVRVRTPFVFIAVDLYSIAVDRVHPPPRAADDPRPYERAKETGEKSEAEAGMKTGVH
jgi:hypothetical protein